MTRRNARKSCGKTVIVHGHTRWAGILNNPAEYHGKIGILLAGEPNRFINQDISNSLVYNVFIEGQLEKINIKHLDIS